MKSEKVSQFVIKLIKLTRSGELTWRSFANDTEELPNGEFVVDKIYEATISGKKFHLYRYKFKFFRDEFDFEWAQRIRLELMDSGGNTDYEFEYDNSMNDLYDIVREQTSNVTDVVDDILGLKLEIIEATYFTPQMSVDVTEQLKTKISSNRLVVDATNDIAGDPEYGVVKKLKVKYRFAGDIAEKEVQEGQTIILP